MKNVISRIDKVDFFLDQTIVEILTPDEMYRYRKQRNILILHIHRMHNYLSQILNSTHPPHPGIYTINRLKNRDLW